MKQSEKHNGFRVAWLVAFEAILTPLILIVGQMSSFFIAVPLVLIPALFSIKKLADNDKDSFLQTVQFFEQNPAKSFSTARKKKKPQLRSCGKIMTLSSGGRSN